VIVSRAEVAMVWRLFRADAAHNRKRIALTVLAIGWGTLSIVLLLSFGEGMKRSFHRNSRGMGEGIGVVWAGATTKPYMGLPSGRTLQFTDEDAEIIGARIPEIAAVSREYAKRVPVSNGTKSVNARVRGVDPAFGPMRNQIPLPGGRFPNARDLAEKRRVVFLGDELATDLFGKGDPVGQTCRSTSPPSWSSA
jgi:putative ABC transport system permease protein